MSNPEIRARFIRLAVMQAKEASKLGDEACYRLLVSTLDITKVFPKELVQEEINITTEAMSSKFIRPAGYSQSIFESLSPTLFLDMTPVEVEAIANPNPNKLQSSCSAITKFYAAINRLPAQDKDIVTYGLLSN
jgi:hypothetical protein